MFHRLGREGMRAARMASGIKRRPFDLAKRNSTIEFDRGTVSKTNMSKPTEVSMSRTLEDKSSVKVPLDNGMQGAVNYGNNTILKILEERNILRKGYNRHEKVENVYIVITSHPSRSAGSTGGTNK